MHAFFDDKFSLTSEEYKELILSNPGLAFSIREKHFDCYPTFHGYCKLLCNNPFFAAAFACSHLKVKTGHWVKSIW